MTNLFILQVLLGVIFLSIILLHLVKKNFEAAAIYCIQSLAISLMLLNSFFATNNITLLFVVALTMIVKVVLAPVFFNRLIQEHKETFSSSTYLNTPFTVIVIALLIAITHSHKLSPLMNIVPAHNALLSLALGAIFMSLFLIINRKGALSQAVGMLSLENSIVAFGILAGLEQSPMLQIGIMFDIFVWLMIAVVFLAMIHRHFGSLDTSLMKNLKD